MPLPLTQSSWRTRADWIIIIVLWGLVAGAMLYGSLEAIHALRLVDPDDALRLVQVRDFLASQPWHDLAQYRINPADGGGQIHWSRFIDVQIAAFIRLFELALPPVEAERWALSIYPLVVMLLVFIVFHRLLTRLGDRLFVRVGLVIVASTYSVLRNFVPLRIDHHGWQLLMSLTMLWLALGPATLIRGAAAALAITIHLEISLEGLPYLVIFGGLFAWDWLRNPENAPRLRGFAAGLVVIPFTWTMLLRGVNGVFGLYCDAFSRPYLAAAAAVGVVLTLAISNQSWMASFRLRLVALGVAGTIGAAVFAMVGPQCLSGPFGNLSPIVREYWYEQIDEGHAIWRQSIDAILAYLMPSLAGFAGIVWMARRTADPARREDWWRLAIVAIGGILISLFVLRATWVAHAYTLPGYVSALIVIYRWGQSFPSALLRVPATALCIAALPISVSAIALTVTGPFVVSDDDSPIMPTDCMTPAAAARLRELPTGTIFALIDISPAILVSTPHSVVATGHHRNNDAIYRVISAFMGPIGNAEGHVRAADADYVAVCTNLGEFDIFQRENRNGLAAALARGTAPVWLVPLPAQSVGPLRVYRVRAATPG